MCEKCNHNLEGKYEPHEFEDEIYKNWEENGYYSDVNNRYITVNHIGGERGRGA